MKKSKMFNPYKHKCSGIQTFSTDSNGNVSGTSCICVTWEVWSSLNDIIQKTVRIKLADFDSGKEE